jgi:hypothetical protein
MASNLCIAVGEGGNTISTSTDSGLTWTGQGTTMFSTSGNGVAGPATYDVSTVAVNLWIAGGQGTNGFATSLDGINWTGHGFQDISGIVRNIAYGNGLIVAVGSGGNSIATSTDGLTWTGRTGTTIFTQADGVAYENGLWVAVGSGGNSIATSTDGLTWTGLGLTVFTSSGYGVVYGNGLWVAVGSGGNTIATSTNGTNWTGRGATVFTSNGYSVAYANNLWVAVGEGGNTIATSVDGINWTGRGASAITETARGVAYGNGLWVASGNGGNNFATSTNGTTWTGRMSTMFSSSTLFNVTGNSVRYGNGLWVAGGYGAHTIATSTDGITWTGRGRTIFSTQSFGVAYGQVFITKPTYVAVGEGTNTLVTSTNGTNWRRTYVQPFNTPLAGYSIAWNGVMWIAGSGSPNGNGSFASSEDGIIWTTATSSSMTTSINGIAYGKDGSGAGLWVAVGSGGNAIATSSNGTTWTGRSISMLSPGHSVAYGKDTSGNGLWVAVGSGGNTIATSTDGLTWTGRGYNVFTTSGYDVAYANNLWVAVGQGGNRIATSTDGTNWTGRGSTVFTTRGYSVAYANNLWVAVGQGGNTIATSVDGITWTGRGTSVFTTTGRGLLGLTTVEPMLSFTVPAKTIGDTTFTITPPTTNSTGAFTYTSSNASVATIDGTTVTIVGLGTSTITAVQASTDFFISGTVTASFTVTKIPAGLSNFSVPEKTAGDASFNLVTPTTNSDGAITYTSSNTAVATVAGNVVTIVGGGTSTITATQATTSIYAAGTITATLTVNKITTVLSSFSAMTKTFGDVAFALVAPTTNSNGVITYSSSNTAVATVSGSTVTIVGAGTATITASQATTSIYAAGTITATLTVNQKTAVISNFSVPAKTFGNAAFSLVAPTTNSTGSYSYTSSNTAVATVSGSTVTIVGVGSSIITVVQNSNTNYTSSNSLTATLTVSQATPTITNFSVATKTFGNAPFSLVPPTTNSTGLFTYTSSNTAVATIDVSTVTIVGPGSSTITATQESTANYLSGSITATFTVNKITTVLSNFSVPAKTFGDASFGIVTPTTNSDGTFTYTSSNSAVATVAGNIVTIVGGGTATITATQATSTNYLAQSTTATLTVSKATTVLSNFSAITKTFGNAAFALVAPTTNSTGSFSYTSSNTAVATVSGSTVTIVGAGTATITANQATNANFLAASTTATLTVSKATPTITNFVFAAKTFGNAAFSPVAPTTNSTGAFTYTSSNTAVATVSGTTITIVGGGTSTITATQATTANYESGTITTTLTVNPATTVLSNFSVPANKLVDDFFTLATPTSNRSGGFTYTSSNTAVATIVGNVLTVVGGGTSTISAIQTSTTNYASATITATLTISQITTVLSNFSVPAKKVGDADLISPPTTNSNGTFTYTSSNTSVATIVGNTITCVGVGSSTITAIQASNPTYTPASITTTVQVTQGTLLLTNFSVPTKTILDASFSLVAPTTQSIGTITYTSSNPAVATVNGSTITIVGLGTSTITASQATTVNYTSATITAVFQVIKATPGLTNFSVPTKTIGNPTFLITHPTTNSDGAFTYTSSDINVATIAGNRVTIRGVGTSTITAVQATTETYISETITATFQVNLITTVLNNLVVPTKTFGDIPFKLQASSNSSGAIVYTSSNTAVATIVDDMVTIVGTGTSTITASQNVWTNYASATTSETLTVNPITTVLSNFSISSKRVGDASFNISPPSTNSNGSITYTSSNTAVATIAGNAITIVGAGSSTITASQASNANYSSETITASLIVSQAIPVLTNFSVPAKVFGDASFNLSPPSTNSNGSITYTSSNTLVATVSGNAITIVGVGSVTITATQSSTTNYTSGIITVPFVVSKGSPNLTNFSVPEKSFGSTAFSMVPPTTNGAGAFTYTSSNTDVATIAGSTITIVGIGSSTITATQATTTNFLAGTITATFTVIPGTSTLTNFSVPAKTTGDTTFSLVPPTTPSNGAFTYTSSNTAVATINGSTVTIVGAGSSTITATQATTANFASAMISSLFTVNRITTVLSGFSVSAKTFGDASFALVPPTSNSNGLITYTSSNTAVATIDGNTVTIVGAGNSTITANQATTAMHGSATITATVSVSQVKTVLTNFSVPAKIIGTANFDIVPPSTISNGVFTYTSSNTAVATIVGDVITLVGLGTSQITAIQANTTNYTSDTISATLHVSLITTVLTDFSIPATTIGSAPFTLDPPTSNSTGTFTYTSSNLLVATVAGSTVTIVGTGSCTITAVQSSTSNSTSGVITASLVVGKSENTISNLSVPAKEFGNAPFTLIPPTTNSNGPITYTSSNTEVATISRNVVTIVGIGTSTITANQASTVNFPSGTTTATFVVSQGTPALSNFSVPPKTIGDATFTLTTPSSNSSGAFTYTSSNTEVATIENDVVTIVGAGSSSITASQASTTNFISGTTTGTLQVNRITTVLTNFAVPAKTFGDASFSLVPPTTNSDSAFTYTSSNTGIATVDGAGNVTIVGAGNVTITASQAITANYGSGTISALFQVNLIKTELSEFSIPIKIIGESAFAITPPTTNSDGDFTYTSSNPAVATIEGDVVTIVGLGTTTIIAVQPSTANYTSDTITAPFQVKLIRTVLSNFSVPTKTVGDSNFALVPPTTNSSGAFTYTSSNLLVATVSGDVVSIIGTGNVSITAFQESTENSTPAKISASLTVNKGGNSISWFSVPEKSFGNEPFTLVPPTTNSNGAFTYISSNTEVATISRNVVTIVGIGTSTITANQAGTVNFAPGTISSTFTVYEGTPRLSNFSVPTKTLGDASFSIVAPTSRSDGLITYTSSDTDVATIEGSTITIVGAGTSFITAEQASTTNFVSGTIIATLQVNQIAPVLTNFAVPRKTFGSATFTLVPPTTNSSGDFTYTSSNIEVATIEDNVVTIVEAGNTIITAVQESTDSYTSGTINALFIVDPIKTVLSNFSVPAKIIGEGEFVLDPPTTESDGDITYTSSNPEVATIEDDTVTIVGLGTTRITAVQESTTNYTSDTITTIFQVNLITTVLTNFSIPEKAVGSAPFTLDPPTSNSDGNFTYTSSNLLVATIAGSTVTIVGVGSSTITAVQTTTANSRSGSITASLVVTKSSPTITNFSVPEKAFGNEHFTLFRPTTNSNGAFTYTSSNTDVATIAKNVVTIVGAGTSTITAVQASSASYLSGTITATLTVIPGTTVLSNFSVPAKTFGDSAFGLVAPRTNSDGDFTYTSSNTDVATIDGNTITIVGAGTSTITADQASNANYLAGTITATFTVNRMTTVLSNFSAPSKAVGNAPFALEPPTTNSDSAFTYTSSKLSVATIDGNTVTIVGGGTSTITASQAITANYTSATITAVFRVSSLTTVLSNFTIPTKAVGNAPFAITPPTTNGDGAFTYTSSNTAIATVAGTTITIVGAGSVTITASQASTENYSSATITAFMIVNKGAPAITNFTMPVKEIGMADFTIIDPSSASMGAFTYTSSDIKVATIFRNTVSIKAIGTSTITASQAMTANHIAGTVTTPFVVNQLSPTLSTSFVVPATKTMGDAKFKLVAPKSNSISPFIFTSSNVAVATIAKDTVTVVGAGTTIISATQASTKSYGPKTVTGTMTVNQKTTFLTNFSIARRIIGIAPFAIVPPTTNSNGAFTYTSSNTAVATIAGTTITIVGVGSTTITANQASTANFTSGTISTTLMVVLPTPQVGALQITNKSLTNPAFTIVDPTKPNDNTGTWTYTSTNATISGNEVTMIQPGIVTITGVLSSDTVYNSRKLMTQFSVSDQNVAPSSFVFVRSAEVEALVPTTVLPLSNTVIPLTVSTPANNSKFNPITGTIAEKQANQSLIVNTLYNMFPSAITISVPTPLFYVPLAFNKTKLKTIKLVRPTGTTVETPLVINTIASDSAVAFLCSFDNVGNGVKLNGVGTFATSFIQIVKAEENKYLVIRSNKGVSTSAIGASGDIISFVGVSAMIGYS